MKHRTARSLVALLVWSLTCTLWAAPGGGEVVAPPYAKGHIIVKFKGEGEHALEASAESLFESHTAFQGALRDRSTRLDQLHRDFKVRKIRPLFRHETRPRGRANHGSGSPP